MTEAEAKAIMKAGLGRAELELVTSFTAPLFWIIRGVDGTYRSRNGSAFFLDAGEGPFGATAAHVIEGWRVDRSAGNVVALQLGDLPLDPSGKNGIIAAHEGLDIATFRITPAEISELGKSVLTGYQRQWPPLPPERDRGILIGGFPGADTIPPSQPSPHEFCFGAAPGGGVASSISETDVSSLIERENLIPLLGAGIPPENYDFRGLSGGPMLTIIEQGGLRSWSLAGVVYQGPNPSPDPAQAIAGLEIIKARRAHFILPDGTLDIRRWDEVSPGRNERKR